jgi:hypothetical protein
VRFSQITFALASITASLFCVAIPVKAATIPLVDQGTTTLDPNTNLVWLDLTQTQGISYNDVVGNNGVNFISQGWRYATLADFLNLAADAGVPVSKHIGEGDFAASYANGLALIDLLGVTSTGYAGFLESFGLLGTPFPGTPGLQTGGEFFTNPNYWVGAYTTSAQAEAQDFASNSLGSYLIRDADVATTPLPGSFILFASGLCLIGFVGWRRRRIAA